MNPIKRYVLKCYLTGLMAGLFILWYFKLPFWTAKPADMIHNLSHWFTIQGLFATVVSSVLCFVYYKQLQREVKR